ncbi:hypothetical protein ABH931_005042 [Streptacidiphilus sp. MAP12-33]|uniref:hypothetical protein n=1 Tax=Streptacidiphilus sp. MAP12-33 TaxID=3156266 RepID=UPI0035136AA8
MGVLIPILLWCGLITLWLVTPRRPVWQARKRSRTTAAALAAHDGMATVPDGAVGPWPWHAAPFHYGAHRSREEVARGQLAGRPARSYAYCCVDNGVARWSDVLELSLLTESATLEVFHEPPYSSASVSLPTNLVVQATGDVATDQAWQVRYDSAAPQDREPARAIASRLSGAPERFSLRAQGGTLVVWRDGGFDSAASAEYCAEAALAAVAAFSASRPVPAAA